VFALNPAVSNVFLALRHSQTKGRAYTSANQSASHFPEKGTPQGFLIKWEINPNAVSGAGTVNIVAEGADGNTINIKKEGKTDVVSYNVNIGGNIDVTSHVSSFASDTTHTAFIAQFHLKCQGRELKGAALNSFIYYKTSSSDSGVLIQQLPVATNELGGYEVSWVDKHSNVASGIYQVLLYRQVDRARDADAAPLASLEISHKSPPTPSPISTAFFVCIAMVAGIYYSFGKTYKSK